MFFVDDSFYLQKRHNSKCVTLVENIIISLETFKTMQMLFRQTMKLVYF